MPLQLTERLMQEILQYIVFFGISDALMVVFGIGGIPRVLTQGILFGVVQAFDFLGREKQRELRL